jgi:hypothetical protein
MTGSLLKSLSVAILTLSTALFSGTVALGEESTTTQYGRVKVTIPGELQNPTVHSNLPFSDRLLSEADLIMATQRATQLKALANLKRLGAVSVKVVLEKNLNEGALKLLQYQDPNTLRGWRFQGFNWDGKRVGQTTRFPIESGNFANYLTKPTSTECSLLEFSIFDSRTWFQKKYCEVKSPKAYEFLRAALGTYLAKSNNDFGAWELEQLKFALEPGHKISIEGNNFVCPDLASISGGITKIPLSHVEPLGGYMISLDLHSRTAAFKYLAPNQEAMARLAHKSPGQAWIDFANK